MSKPAPDPDTDRVSIVFHMIQASYGDALLIEDATKSKGNERPRRILIDGGPATSEPLSFGWWKVGYSLFQTLNAREIDYLDLVVVTHNDHDHVNGIAALLSGIGDPAAIASGNKIIGVEDSKTKVDGIIARDLVIWSEGYESLNRKLDPTKAPVFPIGQIWYNDLSVISNRTPAPSGWCKTLLELLTTGYPKITVPGINGQNSKEKLIGYKRTTGDDLITVYGPGDEELARLQKEMVSDSYGYTWTSDFAELQDRFNKATITELENQTKFAEKLMRKWRRVETKATIDKQAKNLSSIMFEYDLPANARKNSNGKILLTGDSTGEILRKYLIDAKQPLDYTGKNPRRYRIMKVMHHGSARNCWINPSNTPGLEMNEGVLQGCKNFFATFSADVYSISGNTLSGNPNPDSYLLEAICYAHVLRKEAGPIIAVTNILSLDQVLNILKKWSVGTTSVPQIWTMKGVNNYASILPEKIGDEMFTEAWAQTQKPDEAIDDILRIFPSGLQQWHDKSFLADTNPTESHKLLAKALARPAPDDYEEQSDGALSIGGPPSRKRQRKTSSSSSADGTTKLALTSGFDPISAPVEFFSFASTGTAGGVGSMDTGTPVPTTKPESLNWHDLMTANMTSMGLFDAGDFKDTPIESPVSLEFLTKDGYTPQWVDMATLTALLLDYNQVPAASGNARIPSQDLRHFRNWYGKVTVDADPVKIPVVATFFLANFFGSNALHNLMTQLPINYNGTLENEKTYFSSRKSTIPVQMGLTIEKFRAKVVIPTQLQGDLLVLAFHFELAPPITGWAPNVKTEDVMQWAIPIQNRHWKRGQIWLKHKDRLRVKILYPQNTTAVTFAYFNSTLSFTRDPSRRDSVTDLDVTGRMIAKSGPKEVASYDIRLNPETTSLLDMVRLWSPLGQAVTVNSTFTSAVKNMELPGINLNELLTDALKVKNGGFILKQFTPWGVAVDLDDVYGTIDLGDEFKLATDAFGFPSNLGKSIEKGIPDLTITLSDLMMKERRISFAFSWDIPSVGFVAVQIGSGADSNPRFDLWLVTDPKVDLSMMLNLLGFASLTDEFETAKIFSDNVLSLVSIPLLQVTISQLGEPKQGVKRKYGVENLAFMVELDDFSLPTANPVVQMENMKLTFERRRPATKDGKSNPTVQGQATMTIKGVTADLTFDMDPERRTAEAFMSDVGTTEIDNSVLVKVTFPGRAVSFADVVTHFAGDVDLITNITDTVPKVIKDVVLGVLGFVSYREISFEAIKVKADATNPSNNKQKWEMSKLVISIVLAKDVVKKLNEALDGKLTFDAPNLTLTMLNPSDKQNREWNIFLNGYIILGGTFNELQANFFKPPPALTTVPTDFGFTLECGVNGGRGLRIGELLMQLADTTMSAAGVDIKASLPDALRNVAESVDIRAIRVSFTEDLTTKKYRVKILEAVIEVARDPLVIIENYELSDIVLHFTHSTGVNTTPTGGVVGGTRPPVRKDTTVSIDGKLKLGPKHTLSASVRHSTSTGAWSISLTDSDQDGIDIVDLIFDSFSDITPITFPSFQAEFQKILKINISSFFISYQPSKPEIQQPQQLVFSQTGEISLFGVGSKSIRVILEKVPPVTRWDWTVAVALPSPCYPLKEILGSDVFAVFGIRDGHISVSSGAPSAMVSKISPTKDPGDSISLSLSGKIVFENSAFFDLVREFVKIKEVDFMISVPKPVLYISLPLGGDKGVEFWGFTLQAFRLRLQPTEFALGAAFMIKADWLSKNPVNGEMFITTGAGLGAEFTIKEDLVAPFGLEFLVLGSDRGTHFALMWAATAVNPKSMAVRAGVKLMLPGAERIKATLDCGFDVANPMANFFIMQIENLTLKNLVAALTNGKTLPAPLDSDLINIGFESLNIAIIPAGPNFKVDAKFYFFFLRGQVLANADLMGLKFAATLDKIDILGLVKLTSAHDDSIGPFCYLDTTVQSIIQKKGTPPAWLDAQLATDPKLKDAFLAISGHLVFLGSTLKVYGYINTDGLELLVAVTEKRTLPGITLATGLALQIIINSSKFFGQATVFLMIEIDFSKLDFLGVGLGGLSIELLEFEGTMSIQVVYVADQFNEAGLVFKVHVGVEVLQLGRIEGDVKLDVGVKELEDIPDAVRGWLEDEIVDELEGKILGPIIEFGEDVKEDFEDLGDDVKDAAEEIADMLRKGFNLGAHELIHALIEAGYGMNLIADILKTQFDMTISEIASEFIQWGEDINRIAQIVGDAFAAFPNEVAGALISAGVAIEHAFESAFDAVGKELAGAVSLVGNSIVGFAEDVGEAVQNFFENDVKDFFEDVGGAIIDGITDVAEDIADFFDDICVIV